jgi:chemotaxis signal transduction protein
VGDPPHSAPPEDAADESPLQPALDAEQPLFVFQVAGVVLAIPADMVDGVSAVDDPTPIPGTPGHVMGLVAVGDRVLPLVDLAVLLDLGGGDGAAPIDPMFRRTILVRAGDLEAGLVCHRARGLLSMRESALHEPRVLQGSRLRAFVTAEFEADQVGGVLDLPALLQAAAVT